MSEYRLISLSGKNGSGKHAIVDLEDFAELSTFRWHMLVAQSGLRYAARVATKAERLLGAPQTILMHRQILRAAPGVEVDHGDGDGLNNRRLNLTEGSHAKNMQNRKIHKNNTSGYPGVVRHKKGWRAQIRHESKTYRLGNFRTLEEAVAARLGAERVLNRTPRF